MDKYKFIKYKKIYPRLFEKEKIKLKQILPKAEINHIGSTSVVGLGGKGIIDILIGVSNKGIKKVKEKLIKSGYKFDKKGGDKNRIFFEKDYGILIKRRVHLQLTSINSKVYKEAIKFRDILKKDKKVREKYAKLKKEAVSLGKINKDYREFKKKFIEEVLK